MQDGNEAAFGVDSEVVEAHEVVLEPKLVAHQVHAELLGNFVVPVDPVREPAVRVRVELDSRFERLDGC